MWVKQCKRALKQAHLSVTSQVGMGKYVRLLDKCDLRSHSPYNTSIKIRFYPSSTGTLGAYVWRGHIQSLTEDVAGIMPVCYEPTYSIPAPHESPLLILIMTSPWEQSCRYHSDCTTPANLKRHAKGSWECHPAAFSITVKLPNYGGDTAQGWSSSKSSVSMIRV
ncbi:hypothetical protein EDC04DRAFT_3095941 [Pisolithus marmoratus]|nr:hypothetical protein EDC04DRAFT_3095941 [Pisolithus marmoratus]